MHVRYLAKKSTRGTLPSDSITKVVYITSGNIIKGQWNRKNSPKDDWNEFIWNMFFPGILYTSVLKLLISG